MKNQIVSATIVLGFVFGAASSTRVTATATDPNGNTSELSSATGQLLNISTRLRVLTGEQVLINGFIITGSEPKKVIVRGIGPSLSGVGITLADPTLELHKPDGSVIRNDNWKIDDQTGQSQEANIRATTIPPSYDLESALVATLNPGAYTAILAGKGQATGVGLVEVYDLTQSANSKLANISSRGFVDTGDNVMIGGIIIGPSTGDNTNVMLRAIGPSLSGSGVQGALQDPLLELHDGNGTTVETNDNWKVRPDGSSQEAMIQASTIPPMDDRESAIVHTFAPGNYTAIVKGKNNTIGVALVEAYHVENLVVVTVPDVTGLAQSAATSTLNSAGLTVGAMPHEYSGTVAADNIIRQTPVAGASVLPGAAVDLVVSSGLPTDPITIAPPLDPSIGADIGVATQFLYTGPNPIQTGVSPGTILSSRAAVLKGKVFRRDGTVLSSVRISVLNHPEFGQTLSRSDGAFDLAVNGGGQLTVRYERDGFIAAQRAIVAPWRDYASLPDVVLVPYDTKVTTIDLSASSMQIARGSAVSDADGARQATVMVPAGTSAEMVLPNGSRQTLAMVHMRATEYTIGDSGPKAMPAALPPSSGYTYCNELSVDEAVTAGAAEVRFSQALPTYVENFIGFPVGTAVPTGYYDRQKGEWVASLNGRVVKVLSISNGLADLDIDGDNIADDATKLAALGITTEERARVGLLYAGGQTLWRVPITHFTPYDHNWPYGPPPNAAPPPGQDPDPNATPAPGQNPNNPPVDDPHQQCGSVIGCEDQTLGESVPVTGTPWRLHYTSGRTPGRKENILHVPVSGATVPSSLLTMRVEVNIAGQLYRAAFAPAADLTYTIDWDGKDGYGRPLQGAQTASIQVFYDYVPQYYAVSRDFENSFARAEARGFSVSRSRSFSTITLSKSWTVSVGGWDARAAGLGGWSLNIQHAYALSSRTLLLGDGRQRSAEAIASIITAAAGTGVSGFSGEGGPAPAAQLNGPQGIAAGPDGSLYIADRGNNRVRRIRPDGSITTVAGNGTLGFSGDGGPATAAQIGGPLDVAVGSDGSLFIADYGNLRIRRVSPDGIISTFAGGGPVLNGDGGPATAAILTQPSGVAVGPDGSVFIAEASIGAKVRRVGLDGVITTLAAGLSNAVGVAVGADGSVFIADANANRIRRVAPDGAITTVAGNGTAGFSGDGGPATAAQLNSPQKIALGADGSFFIADTSNRRVRRVGPDGIITTVTGTGVFGSSGDGGPAAAAQLGNSLGVAVEPDGSLFISDSTHRVRRIGAVLPTFSPTDILLSSEDGSEVYLFNNNGRHLKTLDALTGAVKFQFAYSTTGYVTSVTDVSRKVTAIERTGALPTAIVAPGGRRTQLNASADGWLLSSTNPANEAHAMIYSADGLLQTFTDPLRHVHRFTYNNLGRLTKDEDPVGGSTSLNRTELTNGYSITTTSSLGRTHVYQIEKLPAGGLRRTVTATSGVKTVTMVGTDRSEQITLPTGDVSTVQYGPDPRWGMMAPVAKSIVVKTPAGLTRTIAATRSATLADPFNVLSLQKLTDTVTDNGAVSTTVFDGPTRLLTSTTAAGRSGTVRLDAQGREIQSQVAGLEAINYTYDSLGRLSTTTEGTAAAARVSTLTYNSKNELISVQDPVARTVGFAYDLADRITTQTLPDNTTIGFSYDANGNLASITPPGRPAHSFGYTPIDLVASYTPPDIGIGSTATQSTYDADRALTRITRPDGQVVNLAYDFAGRQASVTLPRGSIAYSYDTAGRLNGRTAPGGLGLTYAYDGSLLTSATASGPVAGSVNGTFDARFRLVSVSVNGANPITFGYNTDDLITQAGALTLSRNSQNGFLTGTTLGTVTDARTYNGFGELAAYTASKSGVAQLSAQYTRDALGRITTKSETIAGVTDTYVYSYDLVGRLTSVKKNGAAFETYTYDPNGNRLSATIGGNLKSATYNAQDRLNQYGATTYTYTAAGELTSKTTGAQVTTYNYDQLGNLMSAVIPGGPSINYLIDGRNRRLGKQVNGALVQAFLYQNKLQPIAELDAAGTVVSRFVYATGVNVPAYVVKGGINYRIITDRLGSPRLVINASTGSIAQRMDYDSFGNVVADTSPGFQPFGFAGGLYDRDTKLVRFGARDYDPETGRWTAMDPILFGGGLSNLYSYSGSDPVNRYDPYGLFDLFNHPIDDFTQTVTHPQKTLGDFADALKDLLDEKFVEPVEKGVDACRSGDPKRALPDVVIPLVHQIPSDEIVPEGDIRDQSLETVRDAPGGVQASERGVGVEAAKQLRGIGMFN